MHIIIIMSSIESEAYFSVERDFGPSPHPDSFNKVFHVELFYWALDLVKYCIGLPSLFFLGGRVDVVSTSFWIVAQGVILSETLDFLGLRPFIRKKGSRW